MSYQRLARMPHLSGDIYWLAEPQPLLLATLYQEEPDPDPIRLFDGTVFSPQVNQSPILFRLVATGGLVDRLKRDPACLAGLLITSATPRDEVVYHLRSLLEVRFQQRQLLLRYYDPRVASYLLPTCTGVMQPRWMGPLDQIVWFGGTWADELEGAQRWHVLTNEQDRRTTELDTPLILGEEQLQRMRKQGLEHFAWRWIQDHPGHGMVQVLDWIESGLAAGHDEEISLNSWLAGRVLSQEGITHER